MADTAPTAGPDAKTLFAEFGVRMTAVALNLFIALLIAGIAFANVIDAIGLTVTESRPIMLVAVLLYFSAFWSSPLRATPAQFLFGMRVVGETGEKLGFGPAVLRGASLTGLIVLAVVPLGFLSNPFFAVISLAGYALLFLAAVTPNRQAGHDLLAHSLVVNRIALKSPQRRSQLIEHVSDSDPACRGRRRSSALSIVGNVFVLGVSLFVLLTVGRVTVARDLRVRTSYSVDAVKGLRTAVEVFYAEHARWPTNERELGAPTREEYPDGGYYELEDGGVIRIHFTVKPELMKGSIIMSPRLEDDRVVWECRSEGDLARNHLPATCRE